MQAKETSLNDKCEEIEQLEKKNNYFDLHKNFKHAAGTYKQRASSNLDDENEKISSRM